MQRDRGRPHLCREEKGRGNYEGADEADERPRLVVVEPVVLLFKEGEMCYRANNRKDYIIERERCY